MSYIRDFREYLRQEEFANSVDRWRASSDQGRGMESLDITRCEHCDRPTVAEEHIFTPQLTLDPSEQRDATYYTCEWCGSEIAPGETTPKKPAQREGESEMDRMIRRRA
jgi:hypothetical protein